MVSKLSTKRLLVILILFALMFAPFTIKAQKTRELVQEDDKNKSQKRVALVIGNGAYTKAKPLANPSNDAADMAKTLKELGFEVISGVNQNKRQMETLIREFGTKLSASGGVGLFYYAGHGLQVGGENFLVPVDADIPEEDEVSYSAVSINLVLSKMQTAKNDLNIIILDACRNNPFARSWRSFRDNSNSDGLAKISPPTGTLVLYATEPGKVASDGTGRNGLFTEALLKQIKQPNLEYDKMVKAVSADVWAKSNRQQLPWKEGNTLQDFYFLPKTGEQTNIVINPTITDITSKSEPNNNTEVIKAGTVRKNSIEMELVYIPPGEFMMGTEDEVWAKPVHRVTISEGFWIGKYEVTQTQYEAVMGNNPSEFRNCGGNCPVEQVSWDNAKEFINRMNAKNDGFIYSLPSEAEWEYAARATFTGDYYGNLDGIAWYKENSGKTPHLVGQKQPNLWGLYDVSGNVWEWVEDIPSPNYKDVQADGKANISVGNTKKRVVRGGSWYDVAVGEQLSFRGQYEPSKGFNHVGFRVVARAK